MIVNRVVDDDYSQKRLTSVIAALGHDPLLIPWGALSAKIVQGKVQLYSKEVALRPTGIIHIMSTDSLPGLVILKSVERAIPHLNSTEAVLHSANKFLTGLTLTENGITHPPTAWAMDNQALWSFAHTYGFPIILKQPDGAEGNTVRLAACEDELFCRAEEIRSRGVPLLVQRFIAESAGRDVRVVVVGGKVVAAMERRARSGEFRSNIHQGATAHPVTLTSEEIDIAEKTARVMNLDIVGLDILRSHNGPTVLETNSFPGLVNIEKITKVDVAMHIVKCILQKIVSNTSKLDAPASSLACL